MFAMLAYVLGQYGHCILPSITHLCFCAMCPITFSFSSLSHLHPSHSHFILFPFSSSFFFMLTLFSFVSKARISSISPSPPFFPSSPVWYFLFQVYPIFHFSLLICIHALMPHVLLFAPIRILVLFFRISYIANFLFYG